MCLARLSSGGRALAFARLAPRVATLGILARLRTLRGLDGPLRLGAPRFFACARLAPLAFRSALVAACVRVASCVAPRLVPVLVAANGGVPEDGDPVVDAIRDLGPLTGPQLREVTGLAKKDVDRSLASLHRRLVLTNSHLVDEGSTWGSLAHDLLARKWKVPKRLRARDAARRELALVVLERAGELTAADLSGVFGWQRKEAAAILDDVAMGRDDEAGFRIWTRS